MRADARANRERILACAEESFGELGPELTTEQVARRAGVGVGTVFRHFPTKQALLEAALVRHLAALHERVDELAALGTPAAALRTLVTEMVDGATVKTALVTELTRDAALDPEAARLAGAVRAGVRDLLEQAQAAGEVRRDVEVDTLYALVRSLATTPAELRAAVLRIVLDGLAPAGHA